MNKINQIGTSAIVSIANIENALFDIGHLETKNVCEKYYLGFDYKTLSNNLLKIQKQFENNHNKTLIAKNLNGIEKFQTIGYLSGEINFKSDIYTTFRINNIFVSKEFRNLGIGKSLILHLEDILKSQNISWINSNLPNSYDIFLKKSGFQGEDNNLDIVKHLEFFQ
jgi:ribosomal protein S18 acetylase RimI-like enzyme